MLDQTLLEGREQPRPSAISLNLVEHLAVRRAPAMFGRVDFDFGGNGLRIERSLHLVLHGGVLLVVVLGKMARKRVAI